MKKSLGILALILFSTTVFGTSGKVVKPESYFSVHCNQSETDTVEVPETYIVEEKEEKIQKVDCSQLNRYSYSINYGEIRSTEPPYIHKRSWIMLIGGLGSLIAIAFFYLYFLKE